MIRDAYSKGTHLLPAGGRTENRVDGARLSGEKARHEYKNRFYHSGWKGVIRTLVSFCTSSSAVLVSPLANFISALRRVCGGNPYL
jgi:hypothetical protein